MFFPCRKEIEDTLARLKCLERDLTVKEQLLQEREFQLEEREKTLDNQLLAKVHSSHTFIIHSCITFLSPARRGRGILVVPGFCRPM